MLAHCKDLGKPLQIGGFRGVLVIRVRTCSITYMTTTPKTIIHNYRGYEITKRDTGARRMGREITYTITLDGAPINSCYTLTSAKAHIDSLLDTTNEQREHAARIAAMLLSK